jgi:hypothetical protein
MKTCAPFPSPLQGEEEKGIVPAHTKLQADI